MKIPLVSLRPGGLQVSQLISGLWRLDEDLKNTDSKSLVQRLEHCLEWGMTTFDHADIYGDYGCEEVFGRALGHSPQLRGQMQLITKAGILLLSSKFPQRKVKHYDLSSKYLTSQLEASLVALNTEYVDLFLVHRPDPFMDAEETAEALDQLVAAGKTRYVGVSNFTSSQFTLLQSRMKNPLMTNQVEISVLATKTFLDGSLDQCQQERIRPMAWSPLAGGRLFTKSSNDTQSQRVASHLEKLCQQYEASVDQLAISWLLSHPAGIIPILGSNQVDRLQNAIGGLDVKLSREDWCSIWEASQGCEVP